MGKTHYDSDTLVFKEKQTKTKTPPTQKLVKYTAF